MLRDLQRLRRVTKTLARYGFRELVRREKGLSAEVGELPHADDALPASAPRRFRMMLEELGPTFIKLGQVLSTRPDLVAAEYVQELKQLQDRCEPIPFSAIRQTLVESLGEDPETAYASISEKPLATASIAQVHEARTRDGERVVVKVQRPGIAEEVQFDIDVLYRVARFLDAVFEESAAVEPVGVVEAFEQGLSQELNFRCEAANVREFARLHEDRPDIVVPRVIDELSSTHVLTMTYVEGVPFSRLPEEADRKAIAVRIVKEAFDEVFVDGVFHADPHPGNLLYIGGGRYGILDYGLLGRLTRQMQETLVVLALAVAVRDPDSVARTIYRLGQAEERVDISALRDDIAELFQKYLGRAIGEVDSQALVRELLTAAMRHRIRIPAEYAMLGRAAATLEGLVRELDSDLDVAAVAKPYAERLLKDRVAPENVQSSLYKALLQFDGLSHDLPLQLSQIVSDLSSNRFGVRVGGRSLDRLSDSILSAAYTVSGSILAGAFIVGSFIGLARVDWEVGGVPIVAFIGALVGLTVTLWLGAYALFRPRMKKLSLARLLWRRR